MSPRTILVTGATDGIGLETAIRLAAHPDGLTVLLHGRSKSKLERAAAAVSAKAASGAHTDTFAADLSDLSQVRAMANAVRERYPDGIDGLINNAGVLRVPGAAARTKDGLDVRFAVNTIAPYMLTTALIPSLRRGARVVNLSSAAQAPVSLSALSGDDGGYSRDDMSAYSQSKLGISMWTKYMADRYGNGKGGANPGLVFVAVNPGSLLNTKMVREGFGYSSGGGPEVGARVLASLALDDKHADANGKYFDNDRGGFSSLHRDAKSPAKNQALVDRMEEVIERIEGGGR